MKRMSYWLLGIAVIVMALSQAPAAVAGSTVRGQLYRLSQNRRYPAPAIAVRLTSQRYGPSSTVYSGPDGWYYLYNVPAGAFVLEVTVSSRQVLRFNVQVNSTAYTDVGPIQVP